MTATSYEKLGAFYLGREVDARTGADKPDLLLYDSRDLTTHAVCVGMTGSGKTGLCLSLLEEAAIDGVPAIAIDPKGDLGNLLLTFPQLRAEDFLPCGGVELARWLICQKQDGAVGQRTSDRDPLHFSAGKLSGPVPSPVGQTNVAEQLERALSPLLPGEPSLRHWKLHVLLGGEHRQEVEPLEDESQPGQAQAGKLAIGQPVQVDAQQLDGA